MEHFFYASPCTTLYIIVFNPYNLHAKVIFSLIFIDKLSVEAQ